MTFQPSAYAVDGNPESGNFLRLMQLTATNGAQGVTSHLDCIVGPTTPTATAGIVIQPGAVLINGVETAYQGSYFGYNLGTDTTLTLAATGGTARSDMVIARVEDPTFTGSPWGAPAAGQIIWPRVLSNVSPGAVTVPGGYSAIPLARIDMPASTSTVQASYIHDLRQVANPQRLLQVIGASGPGSAANWTVGTTGVLWPPTANWQIAIPAWATVMQLNWEINDALWQSGNARGLVNPFFGTSVTAPVLAMPQVLVSIPSASGPWRHSIAGGYSITIPASLRGTTQTLQFKQVTDGVQTGIMAVDEGSSFAIVYEFQQLAALA